MNVGISMPYAEWWQKKEVKQAKIFKESICGISNIDDKVNMFLKEINHCDIDKISTKCQDGYMVVTIEYKKVIEVEN